LATRYLTFWSNGFSVGEEPDNHEDFYGFDDPANRELLDQIKGGTAPLHILNVKPGQKVSVKVAHEHADWTEPPKKLKLFGGEGRRLGGVAGSAGPVSMPGSFPQEPKPSTSTVAIVPDANKPITSLQIRLSDGTRLVARFNHTHTVQDLYQFVRAYVPLSDPDCSQILGLGHRKTLC